MDDIFNLLVSIGLFLWAIFCIAVGFVWFFFLFMVVADFFDWGIAVTNHIG